MLIQKGTPVARTIAGAPEFSVRTVPFPLEHLLSGMAKTKRHQGDSRFLEVFWKLEKIPEVY